MTRRKRAVVFAIALILAAGLKLGYVQIHDDDPDRQRDNPYGECRTGLDPDDPPSWPLCVPVGPRTEP